MCLVEHRNTISVAAAAIVLATGYQSRFVCFVFSVSTALQVAPNLDALEMLGCAKGLRSLPRDLRICCTFSLDVL